MAVAPALSFLPPSGQEERFPARADRVQIANDCFFFHFYFLPLRLKHHKNLFETTRAIWGSALRGIPPAAALTPEELTGRSRLACGPFDALTRRCSFRK